MNVSVLRARTPARSGTSPFLYSYRHLPFP